MPYLLAALGGAVGALARWGVSTVLPAHPGGWPWPTLAVNLLGCALIGVLSPFLAERSAAGGWVRPLVGVGLLGGFTTYSAFAVEVVGLVEADRPALAAGYAAVSVVGGVLAVVVGARSYLVLGRGIRR